MVINKIKIKSKSPSAHFLPSTKSLSLSSIFSVVTKISEKKREGPGHRSEKERKKSKATTTIESSTLCTLARVFIKPKPREEGKL